MNKKLIQVRKRRAIRNRAKARGSALMPRLSIFRSNANIYAQLIDDESGKTLFGASTRKIAKAAKGEKMTKTKGAEAIGKEVAEFAKKSGIKSAVLDRGSYRYHGRVKAVAESARAAGLKI